MTTQELSGAQRELADARREREELDRLIGGLEEQVRGGEATEAERELAEQYSVQKLAELRHEAAERRVRDAEAAELRERRETALSAACTELTELSAEKLADACEEALEAIERMYRLGDARQAAVKRHARAFLELGMADHIRHHDGGWVVYEVDDVRYDTRVEHFGGAALLAAVEGERVRRAQIPDRRAKGFTGPEPDRRPMSLLLAERTDAKTGEAA